MKNYEVLVTCSGGIGSAALVPHAYEVWYEIEEKSGLRLLFETGRQYGVAVTETTRVIVKSILTTGFGSDGPHTGQETSR